MKDLFVKDGNLFIMPESAQDAELTVESILKLAKKSDVTKVTMNLTELNMFDALKVATLTSAWGVTRPSNPLYGPVIGAKWAQSIPSLEADKG